MTATLTPPAPAARPLPAARPRPTPPAVPPLQNGDRLTRAEFERRYDAMPDGVKAELVEGSVYMPPAVSHTFHSAPQFDLAAWLNFYRLATPGVIGGDNGSVRLDLDNMPQPDLYLMIPHGKGGQALVDGDGYVAGAPELVCEIAASSASYDLHAKLNAYRRNGVREYVVWRTYDADADYFVLREGRYERLELGDDGLHRSEVFPGLWLDPAGLMSGDLAAVAEAVKLGTATPEHAAFAARVKS